MYAIIPQQIPPNKREEINEKILFCIDSGKDTIPAERIYNCYTGIGGLHNLRRGDYNSYNEYAEAKREFEMGQFFTPHGICRDMVDMLSPQPSEMILDMCCGMGNFFNHLPNQRNAHGFDIDPKAVAVARHLYPDANIQQCDIQQFTPESRYDVIIGNPPFNLKFGIKVSQVYYIDKAYDALNPAGILMLIVPVSFLQSEFWEKSKVRAVNAQFSFIGQTLLDPDAFASLGVRNFGTKIMVFLRHSRHIDMQPYNADDFVSAEELKQRIADARAMKARLKLPLMQETNAVCREELERFEYRLAKYMYELKAHKRLNRHIDKALELVAKFRNQKPPENCTQTERDEWERKKLTPNKVLSVIRRYIRNQDTIRRKEIALVKTSYGFKLKAYAPRLLDKDRHNAAGINGLILKLTELPMPENPTEANLRQHKAALRLIRKKRHRYSLQSRTFDSMEPQPEQAAHPAQQPYGNPGQGYGGQYGYPQQPQGWPQQAHPNGGYPQYAHPNGGMMPSNLLYCDTRKGSERYVWYNPPQRRMMYFVESLKIENAEYNVPGVIYESKEGGGMNVYAFKGEVPTPETKLYAAPFFNVTSASVCMGNPKIESPRQPTFGIFLEYLEKRFWLTEFSHLGGGRNPTKSNLVLVTKAARDKPFNLNELIPLNNLKLKDLLK